MANFDNDGCVLLAEAIIKQAVLDYGKALKEHQNDPQNHIAEKTIRDCERFFLKEVDAYMLGNAIAGPTVLNSVRKRVFEEYCLCPAG